MSFEYIQRRSFRGADCDIVQYPVVARVRERLAGSKKMNT